MNHKNLFSSYIKKVTYLIVSVGGVLALPGSIAMFNHRLAFAAAGTELNLGTAAPYSVLMRQTVTNVGSGTVAGDLGLHPGLPVNEFPPGSVSGT